MPLETDIVARATDIFPTNNDLSSLSARIPLEAIEMLGGFVALHIAEAEFRERLQKNVLVSDLRLDGCEVGHDVTSY
jgi:hypothetical protein